MKRTVKSDGARKLILPPPGSPPSPLGLKLRRLRKEIEESGEKLLTSAEVRREVLRRRGLGPATRPTANLKSNHKLILPPPGTPPSPLGLKLRRLRKEIAESGEKLLTSAQVDREVRRRRGSA